MAPLLQIKIPKAGSVYAYFRAFPISDYLYTLSNPRLPLEYCRNISLHRTRCVRMIHLLSVRHAYRRLRHVLSH